MATEKNNSMTFSIVNCYGKLIAIVIVVAFRAVLGLLIFGC